MAHDNNLLTEIVAALNRPLNPDSIWVADDNGDVRLLLSHAFKRFFPPVSVEFFGDGAAIVERIRRGAPAPKLLLLDFEMPTLNGIETVRTLQAEGYAKGMRILVFSTSAEAGVVQAAYALGIEFFLQKPAGGDQYRDLAKLCLKCLDSFAPQRGRSSANAMPVRAALELMECASGADERVHAR